MTERSQTQQRLERFLSFLSQDPENISLIIDAIRLAVEVGDLDTAQNLLFTKHHLFPAPSEYHALAGRVALIQGEFERAVEMLSSALECDKQLPETWLDLAHAYHYLNKPEPAIDVLEKYSRSLKELYPSLFFTLYARLLYILDNSHKAIEQLETFHTDYGPTAESAGLLSLILFEEDISVEQALRLAELALSKNPNALEALIARTSIHLMNGQYQHAASDISRAVQHHPQNGRAWSSVAQVEFSEFRFEKARDAATTAVTYMKDHIGTWHLLGWAHIALNEMAEALEAFKFSYELDKSFAETHGGLAAVYAHLGKRKEAERHIKLAEKLGPDSFAVIYAKTVMLRKNNRQEEANQMLSDMQSKYYPSLNSTPKELIEKRLLDLAKRQDSQSLH